MIYFPVPAKPPRHGPVPQTVKPVVEKPVVKTVVYIPPPVEAPPEKPVEVPSLPSMMEMAKNAASSLGKAAKTVARGQQLRATPEEAAARLEICRACPYFRYTDERCSKCGCFMSVKTYLRAERCPVGKW